MPASAAQKNTPKEEVVCINLNGDGSVKKINIVSIFGKLYYEGRLTGNVMPWNISIKYFMDAKECSAGEIAGMGGMLGIKMNVGSNKQLTYTILPGKVGSVQFVIRTEKIQAEEAPQTVNEKEETLSFWPNPFPIYMGTKKGISFFIISLSKNH